ncbi:hypothetical protein Scep_004683 [Stephania cephalantha]|uniref:Uncharacterized protein n=1 Tax=Stephania cephalantha TaxID=152367 RepID=A0AAP0PXI4_9MAGN
MTSTAWRPSRGLADTTPKQARTVQMAELQLTSGSLRCSGEPARRSMRRGSRTAAPARSESGQSERSRWRMMRKRGWAAAAADTRRWRDRRGRRRAARHDHPDAGEEQAMTSARKSGKSAEKRSGERRGATTRWRVAGPIDPRRDTTIVENEA